MLFRALKCIHVIESPHCICMLGVEDCYHFLFVCPLYHIERTRLFYNVEQLCNVSLESLLFGNDALDFDKNMELFRYVETYIFQTERFT